MPTNDARLPHTASRHAFFPVVSLLMGAVSWGIIWYPYRALERAQLPAPVATLATYLIAVLFGTLVFRSAWKQLGRYPGPLFWIGLTAGITNVAYLVAIMQAEVVRVVLLFYLAPLWTVPLAYLLLGEKLGRAGLATVVIAMVGAMTMLWRPEKGMPVPRDFYEWLGLLGGFSFALCNVLVRRAHTTTPEAKSLAGSLGVVVVAIPVALWLGGSPLSWPQLLFAQAWIAPLLLAIGIALFSTSVAMQYGLSVLPANRAAVILLFELIVAAIAAYFLAHESTRLQDWIGGVLIVGAGFVAASGDDTRTP
jgi:drug/metabolite transporter (DMT)-like permease